MAFAAISAQESLSPKYLQTLWTLMNNQSPSPIVEQPARSLANRPDGGCGEPGRRDQTMAIRSFQIWKRRPLQTVATAGEPDRRITHVSPQACARARLGRGRCAAGHARCRRRPRTRLRGVARATPRIARAFTAFLARLARRCVPERRRSLRTRKDAKSPAAEWPVHLFGEDLFRMPPSRRV